MDPTGTCTPPRAVSSECAVLHALEQFEPGIEGRMQNHTKWVETPFRGNFAFRSRRQPPTTFRGASKHHFEALRSSNIILPSIPGSNTVSSPGLVSSMAFRPTRNIKIASKWRFDPHFV